MKIVLLSRMKIKDIFMQIAKTEYKLQSIVTGDIFEDDNWNLDYAKDGEPALIKTVYGKRQLTVNDNPGLYKFSDWLPVEKALKGAGSPITFKSEALASHLDLDNLYITFSGYWPERGATMKSGSFKECEAYSVCARPNPNSDKVLVVASAGNTARAFARVCSENKIPLLLTIPEDNISALYFDEELDPCVKVVAAASGGDYFDAIHLSNVACGIGDMFYPEGGAKNVARRDGMGTTVLSAVTTIGAIPEYYFQAIGSGTGAIAAWEANMRFIEDGRFGNNVMRLMMSQNAPFLPIKDAWDADSRAMLPLDDDTAREYVEEIDAKVLSNRKPPYSLVGGLFDCMKSAGGEVLSVTNSEARDAAKLFLDLEGVDIESAAAVAVASLIASVKAGDIDKKSVVMLNITGGGAELFKKDVKIFYKKPDIVIPKNSSEEYIHSTVKELFMV